MIENSSEYIPPTQDMVRGNFTPYPLINPEHLPIDNCFEVQMPHPESRFWCNRLDLPLEKLRSPLKSTYRIVPHPHLPAPIEQDCKLRTPHLGDVLDAHGNPYCKKLEIDNIVYNPYT